jgi:hypothetical protein
MGLYLEDDCFLYTEKAGANSLLYYYFHVGTSRFYEPEQVSFVSHLSRMHYYFSATKETILQLFTDKNAGF